MYCSWENSSGACRKVISSWFSSSCAFCNFFNWPSTPFLASSYLHELPAACTERLDFPKAASKKSIATEHTPSPKHSRKGKLYDSMHVNATVSCSEDGPLAMVYEEQRTSCCCCCWRRIRSSRKRKTEFYWVYRNGVPPPKGSTRKKENWRKKLTML